MSNQTVTGDLVLANRPARPLADSVMRRLLCIPDELRPNARLTAQAHRIFSISIVLSGLRCLLGYVVVPIVSPMLGYTAGLQPAIAIPIATIAIIFDVRGIRRFWAADHRWRWAITALYLAVMTLVGVLLVRDIVHLVH